MRRRLSFFARFGRQQQTIIKNTVFQAGAVLLNAGLKCCIFVELFFKKVTPVND